jgi:hypothetical protein
MRKSLRSGSERKSTLQNWFANAKRPRAESKAGLVEEGWCGPCVCVRVSAFPSAQLHAHENELCPSVAAIEVCRRFPRKRTCEHFVCFFGRRCDNVRALRDSTHKEH